MKILFSTDTQNPSNSEILFGLLELADQELLKRLNSRLFPIAYECGFYNQLFSSSIYFNFLAHTKDEYIGVCSLKIGELDKKAYIFTFGIFPNLRGAGLGTFVLKTLESYLLGSFNCNFIGLHVHVLNEKAKLFYVKNGYNIESILDGYYADIFSPSAYFMTKELKC